MKQLMAQIERELESYLKKLSKEKIDVTTGMRMFIERFNSSNLPPLSDTQFALLGEIAKEFVWMYANGFSQYRETKFVFLPFSAVADSVYQGAELNEEFADRLSHDLNALYRFIFEPDRNSFYRLITRCIFRYSKLYFVIEFSESTEKLILKYFGDVKQNEMQLYSDKGAGKDN